MSREDTERGVSCTHPPTTETREEADNPICVLIKKMIDEMLVFSTDCLRFAISCVLGQPTCSSNLQCMTTSSKLRASASG